MKRTSFYLACLLFASFLIACKDDDHPSLPPMYLDYEALTTNPVDAKRLCLGELVSKLLLDADFREFVKSASVNDSQVWNNEIVLLAYWDTALYDGRTLAELLQAATAKYDIPCLNAGDDLKSLFMNDPALVLKLPDLFKAQDWDAEKVVPFLYVRTNRLVRNQADTDSASMVGFHGAGLIDRYTFGIPKYFPLVLKASEDHVLVDNQLTMHNDMPFYYLHPYDLAEIPALATIGTSLDIHGTEYFIVAINDLVKELNQLGNKVNTPYNLTGCTVNCQYECIPIESRKLLVNELLIHRLNLNALEYEFNYYYRSNSHTILFENVCPLMLTQHLNAALEGPWQKNLMGSFRLVDLFDVSTYTILVKEKYEVDCKTYELAMPDTKVTVKGSKPIVLKNIELAKEIEPGDMLRFYSLRVYFDKVLQTLQLGDGSTIQATAFYQDNVTNYDLFCFDEGDTLGFNSLGLTCIY